jgi:hypothetical protein
MFIMWMTGGQYSHGEFLLPYGKTLGARPFGGVQIRDHHIPYKSTRLFVEAPDAVLAYAHSQIGKPYDFTAIAGRLLGKRNWQADDSWYCFELIERSFYNGGLPILPERLDRTVVTDRDILASGVWKD